MHDSPNNMLDLIVQSKLISLEPGVVKISYLFNSEYLHDYPEVIGLLRVWLALRATREGQRVFWDVGDYAGSVKKAQDLYKDVVAILANKVHLYNRAFTALLNKEDHLRLTVAKSGIRSILLRLNTLDVRQSGQLLEDLTASVFEAERGLPIVERRYKTGDEEIDLIVKNNLSRPFWVSLGSPLILVECKNLKRPVSSREIRDFEVKMQNHRPLVRLGVFIAPTGYSRECRNEMRRMSRADYTLLLIGREELARFARTHLSVADWIEECICVPS